MSLNKKRHRIPTFKLFTDISFEMTTPTSTRISDFENLSKKMDKKDILSIKM